MILDLNYLEDSTASTDMNIVMTEFGEFVEVQGTAEGKTFSEHELTAMLGLAKQGVSSLIAKQKHALGLE